ncbi:threonine dehydratase 1 biosynthetic, chloroplastic-like [Solanum dulcamara]|uniref:threonine dehydratase 1 biosynthetic, chloroplastic-like n=1 Tax=Solanum dulcamara TaxID=45834 RepID=UPI0024858A29|nr:threonine dehydratase 1 biosynthetic, chloroplastic-like [Solanum dulcamara]
MDVHRFYSLKSRDFHFCHEFTGTSFTIVRSDAAKPAAKVKTKGIGFKHATITKSAAVLTAAKPVQISKSHSDDTLVPVVHPSSLQCEEGYLLPNFPRGEIGYNYVKEILTSKVYELADETPLQLAHKISDRLGVNVWLKREDLHPVFSFKVRGSYNMMAKLSKEQLEKGVICSSAGNHAQGVALAAQRLGCNAVIVMPVTTPEIKWKSVERLGATVVRVGETYEAAQAYAVAQGKEEGRAFIPPFDHPDIIIGQGTVGMEINRQFKDKIHAIFVPVGGGGLIAGIAAYMKKVAPDTKIIGVEPVDSNSMALALHHGQRVMLEQVGSFADAVAIRMVGEESFRLCRELIDGVVLVNHDAISASIKDMFEEKRSILEPAGALALAGAEAYCKYYGLKGENIVAVTSGANMNFDRLRLVTELADVGRQREAILATYMPEEPGSFKKFYEILGHTNITELKYRYNSEKENARVLYRVSLHTKLELEVMADRMESSQLHTINYTDNELVKDHLRHLMGGRSNVHNEHLCRFIFPDRSGALVKFLDAFSPRWNISLLHYRAQGETGANVLIGIQVPQGEVDEFRNRAESLGFEYVVETLNEAFQQLMH